MKNTVASVPTRRNWAFFGKPSRSLCRSIVHVFLQDVNIMTCATPRFTKCYWELQPTGYGSDDRLMVHCELSCGSIQTTSILLNSYHFFRVLEPLELRVSIWSRNHTFYLQLRLQLTFHLFITKIVREVQKTTKVSHETETNDNCVN